MPQADILCYLLNCNVLCIILISSCIIFISSLYHLVSSCIISYPLSLPSVPVDCCGLVAHGRCVPPPLLCRSQGAQVSRGEQRGAKKGVQKFNPPSLPPSLTLSLSSLRARFHLQSCLCGMTHAIHGFQSIPHFND